ncbi:MAG: DUF4442 domain-containing protein [Flammeovirgaceae bacterium]
METSFVEKNTNLIPSVAQEKLIRDLLSPKFRLFTATKVPLGFIAGMKITHLSLEKCQTTIPFKFLNINPFKSIYFAAQSMAAELSTASLAMLAMEGIKPSFAFIIVSMEATFTKKATDKVTFTCEDGKIVQDAIRECIETGKPITARLKTVGKMPDGTEVSTFYFTWSFKQRTKN